MEEQREAEETRPSNEKDRQAHRDREWRGTDEECRTKDERSTN